MGRKLSVIEKADLEVQDLINEGGYLLPKQAAELIQRIVDEAVLMKMATVVTMPSPIHPIETVGIDGRVLHAAQSGQALPVGHRTRPTMTRVDLEAHEFKAEVRLKEATVEDNLERGRFVDTVKNLLSQRIAFDMDQLALISDTTAADPDEAQFDGLLKQLTSHVHDATGADLDADVLNPTMDLLPDKWFRDASKWRFLASIKAERDYRNNLVTLDSIGYKYQLEDQPATYQGVAVEKVPAMPNDYTAANRTAVIFTDPKNINFGIWRQIKIKMDEDISAGEIIIVATLRWDVKFAIEDAAVKAWNILV